MTVSQIDVFGIYKALEALGMAREVSEIYASHGFVAGMNSFDGVLRSRSSASEGVMKLLATLSLKETDEATGVE